MHSNEYIFTIKGILNPLYSGGTGNFQLVSRKGNNILDENKNFGTIGIAENVNVITRASVELLEGETDRAGN